MSREEDWGFEWDDPDRPDGQINLLIIDLGKQAIKSHGDVWLLFDELETIIEDFPGYLPVFRIAR